MYFLQCFKIVGIMAKVFDHYNFIKMKCHYSLCRNICRRTFFFNVKHVCTHSSPNNVEEKSDHCKPWRGITLQDVEIYECSRSSAGSVLSFLMSSLKMTQAVAQRALRRTPALMQVGVGLMNSNASFLLDSGVRAEDLAQDTDLLILRFSWLKHVSSTLSQNQATPFRIFYPLCRLSPVALSHVQHHLQTSTPPFTQNLSLILDSLHVDAVRLTSHVVSPNHLITPAQFQERAAGLLAMGISSADLFAYPQLLIRTDNGDLRCIWPRISGLVGQRATCDKNQQALDDGAVDQPNKEKGSECWAGTNHKAMSRLLTLDDAVCLLSRVCNVSAETVFVRLEGRWQDIGYSKVMVLLEILSRSGYQDEELLAAVLCAYKRRVDVVLWRVERCHQAGFRSPGHLLAYSNKAFERFFNNKLKEQMTSGNQQSSHTLSTEQCSGS